jgi:hypothetical protein
MRPARARASAPETAVELRGEVADDLVDYARNKIAAVLAHTHHPMLYSRLRVIRHRDPGRERPVTAQANVDLDGRLVRVQTDATTPREAVDRLIDRLKHGLERVAQDWEVRRRPFHLFVEASRNIGSVVYRQAVTGDR